MNGDFLPPLAGHEEDTAMSWTGVMALSAWLRRPAADVAAMSETQIRSAIEDRRAEFAAHGYDQDAEVRKKIAETERRVVARAREETTARLAGDPRACLAYMNSRRR